MDWVKAFYTAQNDWLGVYWTPVEERDHRRVALVHQLFGDAPKRILELGAGGGQTSIALALAGHQVSLIELLEPSVAHARQLAAEHQVQLQLHQGDFYALQLAEQFDLVLYFDSFGIGTDADQRRLLRRIGQEWLAEGGQALIEVGSPWHWSGPARGQELDLGACLRVYEFDVEEGRVTDRWWRKTHPDVVVQQSLRCYHPADLRLLLEGTGLQLAQTTPGSTIVYEPTPEWIQEAPMETAMTYYARMERANF